MAAIAREPTVAQGEPTPGSAGAVEELPFMKARLHLLQPERSDLVAVKRAQDRTVLVVRRYLIIQENLAIARAQTLSCCEAVEGKGGAVSLKICDRSKFDVIKQSIAEMEEETGKLEQAIRELDSIHCGILQEMQATRDSLQGIEPQQRQMLSSVAAGALQRGGNKRQPPEEILAGDQIYLQRKTQVESQIATAKKEMGVLSPEIEQIEDILAGVGC